MEFLIRNFQDAKLRWHVSRVCCEASKTPSPLSTECLKLAEAHPSVVASAIGKGLGRTTEAHLYGYLVLLEGLVNSCSSAFHMAMAHNCDLQENLVKLATIRAEGSERRRCRHLARLTLLEYSRMFADDPGLRSLAALAREVEQRTGRHLLRAIVLENKSVRFVDPRPQDIVMYSPTDDAVGGVASTEGPAVWPCPVCTSANRKTDEMCVACGSPRRRSGSTGSISNVNGRAITHGGGNGEEESKSGGDTELSSNSRAATNGRIPKEHT